MNRTSLDFLEIMFPSFDRSSLSILIINQTIPESLLESNVSNIKVINAFEKGLSKSRNKGLENASKELLVFTDDDVIYKIDFQESIVNAFNNLKSNVIQFQIEDFSNHLFKKYEKKVKTACTSFDCLNMMSIELVFQKAFLTENNIFFDERFGLGSQYPLGEENIILHDILNAKGNIAFQPTTIGQHKNESSTDLIINSIRYYYLGAFYARIFGIDYFPKMLVKLAYDIKQKKVNVKETVSLLHKAKKGKSNYDKHNK